MADSASLSTTSHLVSHSLREVEGALRGVLETVSEREARVKGKKSDTGHARNLERFYVACRFRTPIQLLRHG